MNPVQNASIVTPSPHGKEKKRESGPTRSVPAKMQAPPPSGRLAIRIAMRRGRLDNLAQGRPARQLPSFCQSTLRAANRLTGGRHESDKR